MEIIGLNRRKDAKEVNSFEILGIEKRWTEIMNYAFCGQTELDEPVNGRSYEFCWNDNGCRYDFCSHFSVVMWLVGSDLHLNFFNDDCSKEVYCIYSHSSWFSDDKGFLILGEKLGEGEYYSLLEILQMLE
jgi:hypothetical protein